MKQIGLNAEECVQLLQAYVDEIDEILCLFDKQTSRLLPQKKDEVRTLVKNLKSCLKTDFQLRDTKSGKAQMTTVERNFLSHTINQVHAQLTIKTNSIPDATWVDNLLYNQNTLSDSLIGLKEFLNKNSE